MKRDSGGGGQSDLAASPAPSVAAEPFAPSVPAERADAALPAQPAPKRANRSKAAGGRSRVEAHGIDGPVSSRRRAIVVAGMHRSGTSAITRVLALLGADLPNTVGDAGEDNEPGFWEPFEVVQAHERLLGEAGSSWDDVSPIDEVWFDSPSARAFENELVELLEANYGKSRLFVVKDPRICRLIPLWLRVLDRFEADPSFVITVRNPLEVAESLHRRDGFTSQKSQLLWLRHVLEAERWTRGHLRTWVSYEQLLRDWTPVADGIAHDLELTWKRRNHRVKVEIERFLSSGYRHHSFSTEDLVDSTRILPSVKRLYALISEAASEPGSSVLERSKLTLDGIYRELGETDRAYGPLVAEARITAQQRAEQLEQRTTAEARHANEVVAERERTLTAANEQVYTLTSKLSRAEAELEELRESTNRTVTELEHSVTWLERELSERQQAFNWLEGQLMERNQVATRLEEELADRNQVVTQLHGELDEQQRSVASLDTELSDRQEAITRLDGELAELKELVQQLAAERDERDEALATAREELEDLRSQLSSVHAARDIDVDALTGRVAYLEGQLAEAQKLLGEMELEVDRSGDTEQQLRAEQAGTAEVLRTRDRQLDDITRQIAAVRGELSNVYRELELKTQTLEEIQRSAAERDERLRMELARREDALSTAESHLHKVRGQLSERDAELSRQAKTIRTAERELRLTRAQLDARSATEFRRRLHRTRLAIQTPFVIAGRATARWARVTAWLIRPRTRPFARAYLALRKSGAFDRDFYLANYRDVARSGMHPLIHYVRYGVRDLYNPNRSFSTEAYLLEHPELFESGENPLVHALRSRRGMGSAIEPVWLDRRRGSQLERFQLPALPPVDGEDGIIDADVLPDPDPAPEPAASAFTKQGPLEASGTNGPGPGTAGAESGSAEQLAAIPRGAIVLLASGGSAIPEQLANSRVWEVELATSDAGGDNRGEIEALRAKGASYLVVAGADRDGLQRKEELRGYLDVTYRRLHYGVDLAVYELSGQRTQARKPRAKFAGGWSGMDILCLPIIDWNYRFQRPQQLMTQLARRGHRVFYAATTFQRDTRRPVTLELAKNVWGVRLPGRPEVNIYTDRADAELVETIIEGLEDLRSSAGIGQAATVVDLPFWAPVANAARERWGWKIVYDCMDEHGGFVAPEEEGGAELRELIDTQERALLTRSDLVVATSRLLYDKVQPVAKKTVLVPNATDFEHFSTPKEAVYGHTMAGHGPLPAEIRRPIIGYYGAISSWFDSEMMAHAARKRPDWSIVLAGRTTGANLEPFKGLENVHLLGELPYEAVPGLLHEFDVACIPFHLIDLTLATNPVKFYEYMSAGKPVVSVELPELQPYEGYYYPVRSNDEFVSQIECALAEDGPEARERRIELGRTNTWDDRYQTLEVAMRPWYQKAAIIIPSYNNPSYLRMCLDSLRDKTGYPNFDVIIVDNGSDQSLIDEVAARSEHDQNLHLIAAGENLGFARATNRGIEAASDADYVVLLNDDTVVTPGWLGRLIGHLNDERIGMVGPVTNWTGNEARIDVTYGEDLEGLDDLAARRAQEYQGEVFDIQVLAMYCVAIRKSLMDRLGRLDERFKIGMFEDDDFAMRVREAGLRVVCAEDVFIHHWGRASFKRMSEEEYDALFEENKRIYEQIWNREWVPHRARTG